MPPLCTVCQSPARPELDSRLMAGESGRSLAASLNLSLPAIYRHIRSGHHIPARPPLALAPGTQNAASQVPALAPSISATLRDVQGLAREAKRHLREARKGTDYKATNGAITAAGKALELVAKLRGELQHGANVNVNVSVEAREAMDLRSQAALMTRADVTRQARDWLAALVEAGDADAMAVVGELVRMLRSAEAMPEGSALVAGGSNGADAQGDAHDQRVLETGHLAPGAGSLAAVAQP